jgi:hypothetical protein
MGKKITSHRDLDVYEIAFQAAMDVFEASRAFPKVETYSLTDQVRRSSRSVCANIAERGESDVMKRRLSASSRMRRPKPLNLRFGLSLQSNASM